MSEELETMGGAAGLDRRDFIRKSAIVGGMVWAAPAMSSLGSRAFAAGTPLDGKGVSGFAFFVENQGSASYKYEWNGRLTGGLSQDLAPCVGTPSMDLETDYCSAEQDPDLASVVATVDGEFIRYTITLNPPTDGFSYTIKWIVVKEGNNCYYKAIATDSFSFIQSDVFGWTTVTPGGTGTCSTSTP